jgi:hypothetical protein
LFEKWIAHEWIDFSNATEIFKSTNTIDPKEELYIERIYKKNLTK